MSSFGFQISEPLMARLILNGCPLPHTHAASMPFTEGAQRGLTHRWAWCGCLR